MNKLFMLLFLLCTATILQASEVDYENNQLKKELLKKWNVEFSSLVEITEISEQYINEGKLFKVVNRQQTLGYVYVGRIISCREGGCSKDKTIPISANYEYFDAYFLYNSNKIVEAVKIFNYRATHGQEVCSRGWLKQFAGFEYAEPLQVGKTIDGISGATISVNALTDEVNYITQLIRNN